MRSAVRLCTLRVLFAQRLVQHMPGILGTAATLRNDPQPVSEPPKVVAAIDHGIPDVPFSDGGTNAYVHGSAAPVAKTCNLQLIPLYRREAPFAHANSGGSARLLPRKWGNQDVPILKVAFGEQIGYVSMIGLFQRLGDGRAHGPTVLLEVSSDLFHQLHEEFAFDFGILMLNLSREMARAIRVLIGDLVHARACHAIA